MISEEYRQLNAEKHTSDSDWGSTANYHNEKLNRIISPSQTVLDYGCGKCALQLKAALVRYDPCIPEHDTIPLNTKFDWVACIDVMEHVEPQFVPEVIADISARAPNAYFVISTIEARHLLPDGSNPHRTILNALQWAGKLSESFEDVKIIENRGNVEVTFICKNRRR